MTRLAPALLAATLGLLPLLTGCMLRSYDPAVPRPEAEDDVVALEAGSEDADDGMALALATDPPAGHMIGSSSVTVIQPDALRSDAAFESSRAAQEFAQQVGTRYAQGDGIRTRTESVIPLFYGREERRVLSKNAFYNEQIGVADQDDNGMITDAEVRAYRRNARQ